MNYVIQENVKQAFHMAKKYYLRFLIRDQTDDLMFGVRREEFERLESLLNDSNPFAGISRFFWFSSIDGRSIAINLADVQAVRFLWDPTALPPDNVRNEGAIQILLRGRKTPLEERTESLDQLYDLFTNLQHGPEIVAYPKFDDEDGEPLQLNANEVVWIIAPTHLLSEGATLVANEDGLENDV